MFGVRLSSIALAIMALVAGKTADRASPPTEALGSRGPMLIVAHGETAKEANDRIGLPAEAHALADEERAAAVALAAMPESSLERLADTLDGLNVRLEARRNPLLEDLEDGDPFDDVYVLLRSVSSALGAASSLSSQRIASSDRHTVVAIAPRCVGTETECFPAWAPTTTAPSDTQRRARFFAWSVSLSGTLRFDDPAARVRAVEALRAASASKDDRATIALVLTGDDLAGASNARGAAIREKARRTLDLVGRSRAPKLLRVLAAEPAPGQLVPWLSLDRREVLVVPRLGSLANPADFEAEIAAAVGAPTWVHRPTLGS